MKNDWPITIQLACIVLMLWCIGDYLKDINNTLNKHPVCTCPVKP